jgi:hypothetical protein
VRPPEGLCSPGTGCQLPRPRRRPRLRQTRHFGAGLCGDDTQEPGLRISCGGDPHPHPTERPDRRGRRSSVRFWPSLRHGHHERPGRPRHRRLSGASGRHGLDRDHGRTGGGAAGDWIVKWAAEDFALCLRASQRTTSPPERRRGTGGPPSAVPAAFDRLGTTPNTSKADKAQPCADIDPTVGPIQGPAVVVLGYARHSSPLRKY